MKQLSECASDHANRVPYTVTLNLHE